MYVGFRELLWKFVQPSSLLLLIFGLGMVGLLKQKYLWALSAGFFCVIIIAITTLTPLSRILATQLEQRIALPDTLPSHIDGIIILGGDLEARLPPALELARQHPEAQVVYSDSMASGQSETENIVRQKAASVGIAPTRLILEKRARDTYENAIFSRQLVKSHAGEIWVMVTSALHMPRALAIFHASGWRVIPYPVAYISKAAPSSGFLQRFRALNHVMREWMAVSELLMRGQHLDQRN